MIYIFEGKATACNSMKLNLDIRNMMIRPGNSSSIDTIIELKISNRPLKPRDFIISASPI